MATIDIQKALTGYNNELYEQYPKPDLSDINDYDDYLNISKEIEKLREKEMIIGIGLLITNQIEQFTTDCGTPEEIINYIEEFFNYDENINKIEGKELALKESDYMIGWSHNIIYSNGLVFNLNGEGYLNSTTVKILK
ncbi:hypothetical protein [Tenacibaculum ovolyticum]|uniref:hypothetical protein n=1 Tax=Tenacibaculum ovolyticum TaxID=104270 RepID=UPI0007ED7B0A|nr:hypothetical protein [Tenacibaculum ovolyticum]